MSTSISGGVEADIILAGRNVRPTGHCAATSEALELGSNGGDEGESEDEFGKDDDMISQSQHNPPFALRLKHLFGHAEIQPLPHPI